jgi:hypothetical protein
MRLIDVDKDCVNRLGWNSNRDSVSSIVFAFVYHSSSEPVWDSVMKFVDDTVLDSVKISVYNIIYSIRDSYETM